MRRIGKILILRLTVLGPAAAETGRLGKDARQRAGR